MALLEVLIFEPVMVVLGGDFNIHVQDTTDSDAKRLSEVFSNFGLRQHVSTPTHRAQATLDLVITLEQRPTVTIEVDPPSIISDHSCITSVLDFSSNQATETHRYVRSWRKVDRTAFFQAIKESALMNISPELEVKTMVDLYNNTVKELTEKFAPTHKIRTTRRSDQPWLDEDCLQVWHISRKCERCFKSARNPKDEKR